MSHVEKVFPTLVKEMIPEEFRRATEVTYLRDVYGTLAALKRMLLRDRGVIVQVGSALAYRGIPLPAAYCGAKHAIQGFMDSLRCELLHDGSNVRGPWCRCQRSIPHSSGGLRAGCPTKHSQFHRSISPKSLAEAIVWVAHYSPRELYVGFSTVKAIIGNKLAPWLGDWYLSRVG